MQALSDARSLDHLVGDGKNAWRDLQAKGLRGLEIDYQI